MATYYSKQAVENFTKTYLAKGGQQVTTHPRNELGDNILYHYGNMKNVIIHEVQITEGEHKGETHYTVKKYKNMPRKYQLLLERFGVFNGYSVK